jgi:hypothetical protein
MLVILSRMKIRWSGLKVKFDDLNVRQTRRGFNIMEEK